MNRLSYFVVIGLAFGCGAAALAQPIITNQPTSLTNLAGTTATFSVGAEGTPPLTYQWLYAAGVAQVPLTFETNALLTLTNVHSPNSGDYSVVVINSEGAVTSLVATLMVLTPPTIHLQPANQAASLFADITLRAAAAGDAPLLYQWRRNGDVVPEATRQFLTITNLQRADAGGYDLVVTNSSGSVTSQVATLTIVPFNSIYAFGFSWTDTHNCQWPPATNHWNLQPCNGPMWPQYLSTNLGLAYVAANNYAFCGAESREVLNQTTAFAAPVKPQLSAYFLWLGESWAFTNGPQTDLLANSNAVNRLYQKGAREIIVETHLDDSKLPGQPLGTNTNLLPIYSEDTARLNAAFVESMNQYMRSKPDVRILFVDVYSNLNEVIAHPSQYGFTKSDIDALDDPTLGDTSFCGPGANYVFWVGGHPTTKMHELITTWHLDVLTNSVLETVELDFTGDTATVQMNHLQIGRDYTLQKSADLSSWTDLHSFTASTGTNVWTQAPNGVLTAFYRLKW